MDKVNSISCISFQLDAIPNLRTVKKDGYE